VCSSDLVACSGYFFGHLIETILATAERYELSAIFGIVAILVAAWLCRRRFLHRKRSQ
jgi:membrane protein DedA with SNARE-associated domain